MVLLRLNLLCQFKVLKVIVVRCCTGLYLLVGGCSQSYPLIEPSLSEKPDWIHHPPEQQNISHLVGISDEFHSQESEARLQARNHATIEFLQECGLSVKYGVEEYGFSSGSRSEVIDERLKAYEERFLHTEGVVQRLKHEASYTEKKTEQPNKTLPIKVTYKVWRLFSISKDECDRIEEETRTKHQAIRDNLNQMVANAQQLAAEGNLHDALKKFKELELEVQKFKWLDVTSIRNEAGQLESTWLNSFSLKVKPEKQILTLNQHLKAFQIQVFFQTNTQTSPTPATSFPLKIKMLQGSWRPIASTLSDQQGISKFDLNQTVGQPISFKAPTTLSLIIQPNIANSNISSYAKQTLLQKQVSHQIIVQKHFSPEPFLDSATGVHLNLNSHKALFNKDSQFK